MKKKKLDYINRTSSSTVQGNTSNEGDGEEEDNDDNADGELMRPFPGGDFWQPPEFLAFQLLGLPAKPNCWEGFQLLATNGPAVALPPQTPDTSRNTDSSSSGRAQRRRRLDTENDSSFNITLAIDPMSAYQIDLEARRDRINELERLVDRYPDVAEYSNMLTDLLLSRPPPRPNTSTSNDLSTRR
jgi:hypothetical protein